MNENYLEKFVNAQKLDYEKALSEIKNGRKLTHWIWYIFPQIDGLGFSDMAEYYSIKNVNEAKGYLSNEYLRNNLLKISEALYALGTINPTEVLGYPDVLKVRSCMTLFNYVAPEIEIFGKVIDKFYGGEFDEKTLEIIKGMR